MTQPRHTPEPRWMFLTLAGALVVAAVAVAQPRPGPSAPAARPPYDYVGVGNALVRVDRDTGRVELLEQRDAPGLSLTTEQSKPWTWREVRVDNRPKRRADRDPNHPHKHDVADDE